jgi:hypothetical protein
MVIHRDLRATPGPEAVSYPSVTADLREAKFSHPNPPPISSDADRQLDDSDTALLFALEEPSFASIPQLARLSISPEQWPISALLNHGDSICLIFHGCNLLCQALDRSLGSPSHQSFCAC